MSLVTERTTCRACGGELASIHDFGDTPIVNFGDKEEIKAPLHLMMCKRCSLLQLRHTLDRDKLFRTYYYRSNANATMVAHLEEVVHDVQKRVSLEPDDVVVDIGANDGTTLSFFPEYVRGRGFDPALEQMVRAKEKIKINPWTVILSEYFSADEYFHHAFRDIHEIQQAKVVLALSMFYDLDDPGEFLEDVKQVLAPDGLFVIEQNYLPAMLENNRFDNIVHEHLCYYSLHSLFELLLSHDLDVEDIVFSEINGGVFRIYVRHMQYGRDHPCMHPMCPVEQAMDKEATMNLDRIETYQSFINNCQLIGQTLKQFITSYYEQPKVVDAYPASTRGLAILQLAGLGKKQIRQAVERNPEKWGKIYGDGIPVVSEEQMRANPPDYLLILAPHYLPEFIAREMQVLENGTKMIVPFPSPRIVRIDPLT